MISIIICSRHKEIDINIANNIKSTIGDIIYEIIWIDNSNNSFSIFSAYNEGVRRAKYDYLCFIHEDINFHSNNWGIICTNSFHKDNTVGMIGVIGGAYISKFSKSWWDSETYKKGQIIQGETVNNIYTCRTKRYKFTTNNVVAIDGLFMFIKKELFINKKITFDEEYYTGFHFYDIDISMQIINNNYKVIVIKDIIIEHKSIGTLNQEFYNACIKFHQKWNYLLPIYISDDISQNFILNDNITTLEKIFILEKRNKELISILNKPIYKFITKILLILKIKI